MFTNIKNALSVCKYELIIIWYGCGEKRNNVFEFAAINGDIRLLQYAYKRGYWCKMEYNVLYNALFLSLSHMHFDCFWFIIEHNDIDPYYTHYIMPLCAKIVVNGYISEIKHFITRFHRHINLHTLLRFAIDQLFIRNKCCDCLFECIKCMVSMGHKISYHELMVVYDFVSPDAGRFDLNPLVDKQPELFVLFECFIFCMDHRDINDFNYIYNTHAIQMCIQTCNQHRKRISTERTRKFMEELIIIALHPRRIGQWIDE